MQAVPWAETYVTCEKRGKSIVVEVTCGLVLHLIGAYSYQPLF